MSDAVAPSSAPSSAPTSSGGAPSTPGSSVATAGGSSAKASPTPTGQPTRTLADQVTKTPDKPPVSQQETRKEAERRRYLLKVDGKESSLELDDNEVAVRLQKSMAADKRMQEAAELRKKFNDALEYGKKNPAEAFKQLFGSDLDEWAEKRIEERYKEITLPEHERKLLEANRRIQEFESRESEQKSKSEAEKKAAYEKQIWEATEKEYLDALDQVGWEKGSSKLLLPIMADVAEASLEFGLELTPAQMASEVRSRVSTMTQQMIGGLKGEKLLGFLGEETCKEVLRAQLAKMKLAAAEPPAPPPPEPEAPKQPMSLADFRKARRTL